jgi:hypothetical protein
MVLHKPGPKLYNIPPAFPLMRIFLEMLQKALFLRVWKFFSTPTLCLNRYFLATAKSIKVQPS